MYQIALCDDDAVFSSMFKQQFCDAMSSRAVSYQFTPFLNIAALQRSMESGKIYDLIFLDILFKLENGIEFAKLLRKKNWKTEIVFVTNSTDYALEGYEVAPLHYLLKPIEPDKLAAALDRFLIKKVPQSICFTTPKGTLRVPISDILYFEIYGHEIIIHKYDGVKESATGTLRALEQQLPPLNFVRPHRSYLVNLDCIAEITRYQIRLSSGEIIPVSK